MTEHTWPKYTLTATPGTDAPIWIERRRYSARQEIPPPITPSDVNRGLLETDGALANACNGLEWLIHAMRQLQPHTTLHAREIQDALGELEMLRQDVKYIIADAGY